MPSSKALFEAQEPGTFSSEGGGSASKKYMGPERRRDNRREGQDRRVDVRFEVDKDDRRENTGRREEDKAPKFW